MPKPSTRERSGFCVLLPNTFPELQSVRKGYAFRSAYDKAAGMRSS